MSVRSEIIITKINVLEADLVKCLRSGFDSRTRRMALLGVKIWLSTLEIVYRCVFRMRHQKAVGPFYLVSMPGSKRSHHWKCVTCRGLHILA